MATGKTSPRKRSQEERKAYAESYTIEPKDFGLKLKQYAVRQAKLILLIKNLYQLKKGVYLEYTAPQVDDSGNEKMITLYLQRKDLKSYESKLNKKLMEFKKYFKYSMKKTREPPKPHSFKGTYTPVVAGPALTRFFSNQEANYGPLSPIYEELVTPTGDPTVDAEKANAAGEFLELAKQKAERALLALQTATANFETNSQLLQKGVELEEEPLETYYHERSEYDTNANLFAAYQATVDGGRAFDQNTFAQYLLTPVSSFLQLATQPQGGLLLRNTITMLFFIYIHNNVLQNGENAQYTTSDQVMLDAFDNQSVPALFFTPKGKGAKQLMSDTGNKLTTYKMIADNYPPHIKTDPKTGKKSEEGFKPEKFKTFFFQNIAASNYYSKSSLQADDKRVLENADTKDRMLTEHNIVKSVSHEWTERLEPERIKQKNLKKKKKNC